MQNRQAEASIIALDVEKNLGVKSVKMKISAIS